MRKWVGPASRRAWYWDTLGLMGTYRPLGTSERDGLLLGDVCDPRLLFRLHFHTHRSANRWGTGDDRYVLSSFHLMQTWVYIVCPAGVVASGIMMLIPPKSGHTMVRKANATTLLELARFHTMMVEGELATESEPRLSIRLTVGRSAWVNAGDTDYRHPTPETKAQIDKMRARFIKYSSRLSLLKTQTGVAKFEVRLPRSIQSFRP